MAFDGANIWTANFGDGTVTKLRANDGEVLGTFKAGAAPYGVTFDGANIWVSNQGTERLVSSGLPMAKRSGRSGSALLLDGWHLMERTSG